MSTIDLQEKQRPEAEVRVERYKRAIADGELTVNDVRRAEGLPELRSTEMRRSDADRRQALPTGDGLVVLEYVNERMALAIKFAEIPQALPPLSRPENLRFLHRDLQQRSETGAKKYDTPLRVNNGRNVTLDLYQEVCDAIMYAAQAHLERKPGGEFYEALVQFGSMLAGELEKQKDNQSR